MGAKKLDSDIQYYTFKQASDLVPFHWKTITRFAREGKIRTVKIGGRRFIPKEALLEFIETNSEE